MLHNRPVIEWTNTRANPMPGKPELAQSLACRAATPPSARHKRWRRSAVDGQEASRAEGGEGRGRPGPKRHMVHTPRQDRVHPPRQDSAAPARQPEW